MRATLIVDDCFLVATPARPCLLDISGRRVLALKPGVNDVSSLAPGVYLVSAESMPPARVVVVK